TERHKKEIDGDLKLGEALDLYNTPTIFINGVKLLGDRPIEAYREVIDRELKAVGAPGKKQ
ncbi:MAG: DsbA family protein, partial [Candidatus Deferrimicrobiaceae bacterium]